MYHKVYHLSNLNRKKCLVLFTHYEQRIVTSVRFVVVQAVIELTQTWSNIQIVE